MAAKKAATIKGHLRSPVKIYFLIMTLIGVIGTLISLGILIYTIGKKVIITDQEYIIGDRYYELESCQYNDYDGKETTRATPEEIAKCEEDKKVMLIQSRKVMFKQDMLNWSIWGALFLILLFTHYPRFNRLNRKGE